MKSSVRVPAAVCLLCLSIVALACGAVPPTVPLPVQEGGIATPPGQTSYPLPTEPPPYEPTSIPYTPPPPQTIPPTSIPTITPLPTALPLPPSAFEVLWTESSVNSGILWRADPRDIVKRREVVRFKEGILAAVLSPNSHQVALTIGHLGDGVATPLWIVNVDGTGLRELVPNAGQLLWSQTSQAIFYSIGGEGWVGIERVTIDSGKVERILTIEPMVGLSLLGWSTDGRWLYHIRSKTSEHNLWRVRQDGTSAQSIVDLGKDLPSPPYLLLSPAGNKLLIGTALGLKWISTDGRGEQDIPLPGQGQGFLPLWGDGEEQVLIAQHDGSRALYHLSAVDLRNNSARELGTFSIPNNGPGWVQLAISPDRQWLMGQLYPSGSYLIYFPSGLMVPLNFEYEAEFTGWIPRGEGQ